MQERTLPPKKKQNNKKPKTHNKTKKKSTKINRFKTLGIYTELNHPLLRDILCSATEKWTMAMGRIIREEPIFFVINVWYSVRFLAEFITLSILRDIFFSSSFYSRYHIEIRTYFYIIYMHNCFHNRGGVFNFQIIRDRIVIAWFFFKFYTFCKVLSSSFFFFFFLSKCTSIPAIIYFLN